LLGLPVPAGLTITTEACTDYYANNCELPNGLMDEVWQGMKKVEKLTRQRQKDKVAVKRG
jgi:pyruvate,orthophosphate dikinase